jgi:hypothetical protein
LISGNRCYERQSLSAKKCQSTTSNSWDLTKGVDFMAKVIPIHNQDPEHWKQVNAAALEEVRDEALKEMIKMVLNLHELEHFSKSTFGDYLQLYARWSLPEFRLLEEAVFENFDELKRKGLYSVLIRLRKEKE